MVQKLKLPRFTSLSKTLDESGQWFLLPYSKKPNWNKIHENAPEVKQMEINVHMVRQEIRQFEQKYLQLCLTQQRILWLLQVKIFSCFF